MSIEYFKHGSWNAICDRCGFQYKAEDLRREWTGAMVCHGGGTNNCWEPRHPQDFIKTRPETQAVEPALPEPTDTFVSVTYAAPSVGVQDNTIPSGTFNNAI